MTEDASTPQTPLDWALRYASIGWHVTPLHSMVGKECSCGQNCASPGKHPRTAHGLKDASTDPATIRTWWAQWPDANVGIATGPSGLLVIDIDPRKNGDITWNTIVAKHGRDELDSVRQRTGGDGLHVVFRNDASFNNSASLIGPGIDTRGIGGYIVATPSNHASGGSYSWVKGKTPWELPLQPLPEFLKDLLRNRSGRPGLVPTEIGDRIPTGRRDSTLLSLAGSLRRRGIPQSAIEAAVLDVNKRLCDPPQDDAKALAIARRYGASQADDENGYPTHLMLPDGLPDNDAGNGDRFLRIHGDHVAYCAAWGEWLIYEHGQWVRDKELRIRQLAKDVAKNLYALGVDSDSETAEAKTLRTRILTAAKNAGEHPRIIRLLESAASSPIVAMTVDHFDQYPNLLNCRNGIVDLVTGRLLPHDRDLYLTRQVPYDYEPDAAAPRWESFILRILGAPDRVAYMQEQLGYALIGDNRAQSFCLLHGAGANGKTTMLQTILGVVGAQEAGGYGAEANPATFMVEKYESRSSARPDLARLHGARFVVAVEPSEDCRLDPGIIKRVTGGEAIVCRDLYESDFQYKPQFKLFLAANNKPAMNGADYAMVRRIKFIPFNVQIPEGERTGNYERVLLEEAAGILAWLVRGALAAQRPGGLTDPPFVREAVEEYRAEMDDLEPFIRECCELAGQGDDISRPARIATIVTAVRALAESDDLGHPRGAAWDHVIGQAVGSGLPLGVVEADVQWMIERGMIIEGPYLGRLAPGTAHWERPTRKEGLKALYKGYSAWCAYGGIRPMSPRKFADRLRQKGFQSRNGTGNQVEFHGIRLGPKGAEFFDADQARRTNPDTMGFPAV